MSEPDDYCEDEGPDCCLTCNGEGQILVCVDDMCRGCGECIHGDGWTICPECEGENA